MKIYKSYLLISLFTLVCLQAADREQISPNSFGELNLRYALLKGEEYQNLLTRPYSLPDTNRKGFLFQLQPKVDIGSDGTVPNLTSWIQVSLNSGFTLINEVVVGYDAHADSTYIGKEWRGGKGSTNQSFLQWTKVSEGSSEFNVQVGRFYNQVGPGRHGQLLLGSSARPLDQFSFSYKRNITPTLSARFMYQKAMLDKINSNKRYLAHHRLELYGKKWYIGLSEALLYSRQNQGVEAVYLNPFIFFHGEQLNGPDLLGNTLGTIDLGYMWSNNHIYLELLIDDVQLDKEVKGDLEPNEIGLLSGYEHAGSKYYFSIEGVMVTNRTYKTPTRSEWFIHRNQPIGYELASDVGRLNVFSRYYLRNKWHIDAELDLIWRGEGNLSSPWDAPWEADSITIETGYTEPFPTGVVENSTILSFKVLRHWSPERWISLGLSYESIENEPHIQNNSTSGFKMKLGASWTLDYELEFDD